MGGLARAAGRTAFGADPANYHAARPAYPDWVFDILSRRCGLRPGAAVFEVGAGTGTASDRLLARALHEASHRWPELVIERRDRSIDDTNAALAAAAPDPCCA